MQVRFKRHNEDPAVEIIFTNPTSAEADAIITIYNNLTPCGYSTQSSLASKDASHERLAFTFNTPKDMWNFVVHLQRQTIIAESVVQEVKQYHQPWLYEAHRQNREVLREEEEVIPQVDHERHFAQAKDQVSGLTYRQRIHENHAGNGQEQEVPTPPIRR